MTNNKSILKSLKLNFSMMRQLRLELVTSNSKFDISSWSNHINNL